MSSSPSPPNGPPGRCHCRCRCRCHPTAHGLALRVLPSQRQNSQLLLTLEPGFYPRFLTHRGSHCPLHSALASSRQVHPIPFPTRYCLPTLPTLHTYTTFHGRLPGKSSPPTYSYLRMYVHHPSIHPNVTNPAHRFVFRFRVTSSRLRYPPPYLVPAHTAQLLVVVSDQTPSHQQNRIVERPAAPRRGVPPGIPPQPNPSKTSTSPPRTRD